MTWPTTIYGLPPCLQEGFRLDGVNRSAPIYPTSEFVEARRQGLVGAQALRLQDQSVARIGNQAPVSPSVGIGQRRAADGSLRAGVIELRRPGGETGLEVAQAFAASQLGKRQGAIVLATAERADEPITPVTLNDPGDSLPRQETHHLGDKSLADEHKQSLPVDPAASKEELSVSGARARPQVLAAFKSRTPPIPCKDYIYQYFLSDSHCANRTLVVCQ